MKTTQKNSLQATHEIKEILAWWKPLNHEINIQYPGLITLIKLKTKQSKNIIFMQ